MLFLDAQFNLIHHSTRSILSLLARRRYLSLSSYNNGEEIRPLEIKLFIQKSFTSAVRISLWLCWHWPSTLFYTVQTTLQFKCKSIFDKQMKYNTIFSFQMRSKMSEDPTEKKPWTNKRFSPRYTNSLSDKWIHSWICSVCSMLRINCRQPHQRHRHLTPNNNTFSLGPIGIGSNIVQYTRVSTTNPKLLCLNWIYWLAMPFRDTQSTHTCIHTNTHTYII